MAQPKAKTRLEQMGFVDPDIKNPSHDDLIAAFIPSHKWMLDSFFKPSIPDVISDWKISFKTEVPVEDGRFIIGFIDMKVTGRREFLCKECECATNHYPEDRGNQFCSTEHRSNWLFNQRGEPGQGGEGCKFCQAIQNGSCGMHGKKFKSLDRFASVTIEFKTSKFTAGEVLRQMNTYRKYIDRGDVFVLVTFGPCPHKPIIRNEKIHIIEFVNNRWFMNWKSDIYDVYDGEVPE